MSKSVGMVVDDDRASGSWCGSEMEMKWILGSACLGCTCSLHAACRLFFSIYAYHLFLLFCKNARKKAGESASPASCSR
jgi:hypothetical protein